MACWIFDLDGVITHLTEKKITNPQLLEYLALFLKNGEPVSINTGRGLPFIHEQVLTPLVEHLTKQNVPESLLSNFFAVGEKGNAWIEDEKDYFDVSTAIPETFAKKVQELIEKDFADSMFFDTTKKTMISLEMLTGMEIDKYSPEQQKLIPLLESMLKDAGLEKEYVIDAPSTSTDIQHKDVGKGKGIERILTWLAKRNRQPDTFVAIGDSAMDLAMGEKLQELGKDFTFVFVGDPKIITHQPPFPITYTKEKYGEGVVEWIEKYK